MFKSQDMDAALLYADCSSMVMKVYFVCWVHRTIELSPGLKVSKLFWIHFIVNMLDMVNMYGLLTSTTTRLDLFRL